MNNSMFNMHQICTCLLVIVTFAWLLQVSAMPLAAAGSTEQVASASAGQATGFIEQQGPEWTKSRKKSPVRIIIIVLVGYVALSILYFLIHGIDIDAAPRTATGPSRADQGRLPAAHFGQDS